MRGLWIEDGEARYRTDLERPPAAAGETRVGVLCAGVCATDLALRRGYMSFRGVPGHEFVGRALDGPLAGERVVGEINAACGECERCRAGNERHCATRTVLGILGRGGAFAEELCLPTGNLHRVPDAVSSDAATFTEPLAAAFEIAEQLDLAAFDDAIVLGDGRLGLLCTQVLVAHGLRTTVVGRHPERAALLPGETPIVALDGAPERVSLVVEASGDANMLAAALAHVAPRGTVVLKTTSEARAELDLAPLVVDEVRLVGSRCGPFAPALAALEAGRVDVERMVDARFSLADGARALDEAARPGVLKVLVEVR